MKTQLTTVGKLEREIAGYTRQHKLWAIDQTHKMLMFFCSRTYSLLADYDRRLRGNGYPETVDIRDFKKETEILEFLVVDRLDGLRRVHVPSQSAAFYQEKIAAYSAAYSLLISIVALTVSMCVALLK